ncbi:MAG TPA: (Fe-S)-binding protein [Acidimicrobiia bacterium]|nr:(Fe-S)-binding protein [Acidimicrobiia bacterium]
MVNVSLFTTCLVQGLYPQVIEATVEVLTRAGCQVTIPKSQTCCGQAPFNAGLVEETRRLAVKTLDDLEGDSPIVVPSGSCADMLTHHLPHLFDDSPDLQRRARAVSARVTELSSFLVDHLGVSELGARFDATVAFHNSCHGMRNLGLGPQAATLLANVDSLRLVKLSRADECCGFGGLFAVELPEVSAAIMASKLNDLEASGAQYLVGGDASCLLHLAGGLHRRQSEVEVRHLAEILASR